MTSNRNVRSKQITLAQALLDALDLMCCTLDQSGHITMTNAAWNESGIQNDSGIDTWAGIDYLSVCEHASGPSEEGAGEVGLALTEMLNGQLANFELVYPCHYGDVFRWYRVALSPIHHPEAAVMVTHANVTEQELWKLHINQNLSTLSLREREVLSFIMQGSTSKQIAQSMSISKNTVNNHRRAIMRKTGAKNIVDLVRMGTATA